MPILPDPESQSPVVASRSPAILVAVVLAACAFTGLAFHASQEEPAEEKLIRGVSYVGVTVSDVAAAAKRLAGSANLKEVARGRLENLEVLDAVAGAPKVVAESRMLESTNAQLRLMQFFDEQGATQLSSDTGAVPVNGPGFAHVCFRSDGANGVYQKFLASGATPIGNPEMVTLSPRFPVLYAYALDPDGIMFEVEHVDIDAIPANKPPKGFDHIRHISLATPDFERALRFYSTLLAIPSPRRAGDPDGLSGEQFDQVSGLPGTRLKMAWFQVGNLELEVVQYLSHPTIAPAEPRPLDAPGYNMVVFDVTSPRAVVERLVEGGGTVVTETRSMDGGEILFGRDPDGNLLGFLTPASDSSFSSERFAK